MILSLFRIQGFTSAPVNIKASRLGDNVFSAGLNIAWKVPLQVNGSIQGYQVMYTKTDKPDSNHTISTGSQTLAVQIENLVHYTRYTIYVRAETNFGNGQWSSPHIFRTHEGSMLLKV